MKIKELVRSWITHGCHTTWEEVGHYLYTFKIVKRFLRWHYRVHMYMAEVSQNRDGWIHASTREAQVDAELRRT